jgi:hypothetical protein
MSHLHCLFPDCVCPAGLSAHSACACPRRRTTHTNPLSSRHELQRRVVCCVAVSVHAGLLLRSAIAQRHTLSGWGILPAGVGVPRVVWCGDVQPEHWPVGSDGVCSLSQRQRVRRGRHLDPHRVSARCALHRRGAVGVRVRAVCGGLVLSGCGADRQQWGVVHDGQRGLQRLHRIGECAVSYGYAARWHSHVNADNCGSMSCIMCVMRCFDPPLH